MNRFTNKNGGILPFQMIKLAAHPVGLAVNNVSRAVKNLGRRNTSNAGTRTVNNGSGISDGATRELVGKLHGYVRGKFSDVHRWIKELREAGVDPTKIDDLLALAQNGATRELLENAVKAMTKDNAEAFSRVMASLDEMNKSIPGTAKLIGTAAVGAGLYDGAKHVVLHYTSDDANNAHAAGATAAQQGLLAAKQNGQSSGWWDRTWNDINKFREENPGWFYGGLGVGLLGGGYALSEMLDDDDEDEEDEYRRY